MALIRRQTVSEDETIEASLTTAKTFRPKTISLKYFLLSNLTGENNQDQCNLFQVSHLACLLNFDLFNGHTMKDLDIFMLILGHWDRIKKMKYIFQITFKY